MVVTLASYQSVNAKGVSPKNQILNEILNEVLKKRHLSITTSSTAP